MSIAGGGRNGVQRGLDRRPQPRRNLALSATAVLTSPTSPWNAPALLNLPGGRPAATQAGSSLAQLFCLVQNNDELAFAQLYLQTEDRLHAVAHHVLRARGVVDDIVQESYLQIWRQRHEFRPDYGTVMGWMTTITRRRAIDRTRAMNSGQNLEARHNRAVATIAADHQTEVTNAVSAAQTIRPALLMLTPREQEVVLLTYWHDQTPAQSAQLLGIPVPTLKSRLHAAITRLRRLLDSDSV